MHAKAAVLLLFGAARVAKGSCVGTDSDGKQVCCFSHPQCSENCPSTGRFIYGPGADGTDPFTGEDSAKCWQAAQALLRPASAAVPQCALPAEGQPLSQPCKCSSVSKVEDAIFSCQNDMTNQFCKDSAIGAGCRLAQCAQTVVLKDNLDVICHKWSTTHAVAFPVRGDPESATSDSNFWGQCPSGYTKYDGKCHDTKRYIGETCWADSTWASAGKCEGHGQIDSLSCYRAGGADEMRCTPTVRLLDPDTNGQQCDCWWGLATSNTCAAAGGKCGGHSCTNKATLPLPSTADLDRFCDWFSDELGSEEWFAAHRDEQRSDGHAASQSSAATIAAVAVAVAASAFALLCVAVGVRRRQQQQQPAMLEELGGLDSDYSGKTADC